MKRAHLYLSSVLCTAEHVNARVLSELADLAAHDPSTAEIELRRLDMQAAGGAWRERSDLPDSSTYIANLRMDGDRPTRD
jgi:hypothetical protein